MDFYNNRSPRSVGTSNGTTSSTTSSMVARTVLNSTAAPWGLLASETILNHPRNLPPPTSHLSIPRAMPQLDTHVLAPMRDLDHSFDDTYFTYRTILADCSAPLLSTTETGHAYAGNTFATEHESSNIVGDPPRPWLGVPASTEHIPARRASVPKFQYSNPQASRMPDKRSESPGKRKEPPKDTDLTDGPLIVPLSTPRGDPAVKISHHFGARTKRIRHSSRTRASNSRKRRTDVLHKDVEDNRRRSQGGLYHMAEGYAVHGLGWQGSEDPAQNCSKDIRWSVNQNLENRAVLAMGLSLLLDGFLTESQRRSIGPMFLNKNTATRKQNPDGTEYTLFHYLIECAEANGDEETLRWLQSRPQNWKDGLIRFHHHHHNLKAQTEYWDPKAKEYSKTPWRLRRR